MQPSGLLERDWREAIMRSFNGVKAMGFASLSPSYGSGGVEFQHFAGEVEAAADEL